MILANPDQAVIPFEKLEGYSLNPNHPEGRHKAIVFQSALHIGLNNADNLRSALRQALIMYDAIPTVQNPYGQKYQLDFEMSQDDKQAMIRSIWMIRVGENFPRLVTCYVL